MKSEWAVIIAILVLLALAGASIVTDFGQSWDEAANYLYGEKALGYYLQGRFLQDPGEDYFHGTLYFMAWAQASKIIHHLAGSWIEPDARHFVNYMTFLSGALGLYALARRFAGRRGAGIALMLFLTQPLLIGHAFINQKDTPFMVVFILTIVLGVAMSESWIKTAGGLQSRGAKGIHAVVTLFRAWLKNWEEIPLPRRWTWTVGLILALVMAIDTACSLIAYPMMRGLVRSAYQGTAPALIAKLFNRIAQDAWKTPLDAYLLKLEIAHFWLRIPLLAMFGAIAAFFFYSMALERDRAIWRSLIKTAALMLFSASALGSLIAMRVIGIFAGLLLSGYLLIRGRKRLLMPMAMYWLFAVVVLYLAWPTLWGDAIGRLWTRLVATSSFDPRAVLFEGRHILSHDLPWYYLPKLMAYQLTEPVLPLAMLGGYLAVRKVLREGLGGNEVPLVLLAWFAIPFLAQVTLGIPIYDNFRQLLFIVPPLIIIAGIGFADLLSIVKPKSLHALLAIFAIAPGLINMVKLHPYEYSHYNLLVGGVSGAYGRFETEYWCTSFRKAVEYINGVAEEGATVFIAGPMQTAVPFARGDLRLTKDASVEAPDFAIACRWNLFDPDFFPGYRTLVEIGKGEAVFARVKSRE